MKKVSPFVLAVAASAALCGVALTVPMGTGALWRHPCVNEYSWFATAFFVMNTVGVFALARGVNVFAKPYTKERPVIEQKKTRVTAVVLAFFELPLLTTVFFVEGGWKMVACSALLIGGSLIVGGLAGEVAVSKMRREIRDTEQRELAEQLKKEEG